MLTLGLTGASLLLPASVSAASSNAICAALAGSVPATGMYSQSDTPPVVLNSSFTQAVQLTSGETLGQVFTAQCPFGGVTANQPTYSTSGVAGDTFTLYAGAGTSGQVIATHTWSKLDDHDYEVMDLPAIEPAGTYTLVFSNAVAKIGLWSPNTTTTSGVAQGSYELKNGAKQSNGQDFVVGYYPTTSSQYKGTGAAPATTTATTTSTATTSTSTKTTSSSSSSTLPKTGGGPLLPITGVLLLLGGAAVVAGPKLRRGER